VSSITKVTCAKCHIELGTYPVVVCFFGDMSVAIEPCENCLQAAKRDAKRENTEQQTNSVMLNIQVRCFKCKSILGNYKVQSGPDIIDGDVIEGSDIFFVETDPCGFCTKQGENIGYKKGYEKAEEDMGPRKRVVPSEVR
jgi:hypothetical protein